MLLNRSNRSKHPVLEANSGELRRRLTNDKPRKESINPPHDQGLRYHHSHIPLHHAHHALHCRWIRHRIRGRFASVLRVLEESPVFVRRHEVSFAGGEGGG